MSGHSNNNMSFMSYVEVEINAAEYTVFTWLNKFGRHATRYRSRGLSGLLFHYWHHVCNLFFNSSFLLFFPSSRQRFTLRASLPSCTCWWRCHNTSEHQSDCQTMFLFKSWSSRQVAVFTKSCIAPPSLTSTLESAIFCRFESLLCCLLFTFFQKREGILQSRQIQEEITGNTE